MADSADDLLSLIRQNACDWEAAGPGISGRQFAYRAVGAFRELDALLSSGGPLPADWADCDVPVRPVQDAPLPRTGRGSLRGQGSFWPHQSPDLPALAGDGTIGLPPSQRTIGLKHQGGAAWPVLAIVSGDDGPAPGEEALRRLSEIGHVLASITATLARIEDKLDPVTPGGIAGVTADAQAARQSAEAASAACQALAAAAVKPEAARPRATPRTAPKEQP